MPRRKKPAPTASSVERICSYPSCGTILSATNEDDVCRCHQSLLAKRLIQQLGSFAESTGNIAAFGRNLTVREARRTRGKGYTDFVESHP
jgi:hypothetical protein